MAYKVLIPQDIVECGKEYLRANDCEIIMGSGTTEDAICRDIVDCDAVIVRTAQYTQRVIDAGKKLKVISRYGIGVDNVDTDYAAQKGIWVTNGPTTNSLSVAEHTIFLMLACAKNASYLGKEMRNGNYEVRNKIIGLELEGKTLGLIGLGKIGRMVAQKAMDGFNMKVIGYDPFVKAGTLESGIEALDNAEDVYKQADFISLHLPATAETKSSVGMNVFKLMKPTAFLINAARGEIVVEKDLVQALETNVIRGAGLDVYENEPIKEDNPLLQLSNAELSPHYAAMTEDALDRMSMTAAKDVVTVLNGGVPAFPVNKPVF